MPHINGVKKMAGKRFLHLYEMEAVHRDGSVKPYYLASRNGDPETLKAVTGKNPADGVIIYAVHGAKKDKLVLIRQYRYPIAGYVYEFPAGLVEDGENPMEGATREMLEETGLTFTPKDGNSYSRPFFTTVGMTDESCATVYGYCDGTPTSRNQESSEDIQVVLADRDECRRILKEENVAIMCAYMLMHFIASEGDPLAFLDA